MSLILIGKKNSLKGEIMKVSTFKAKLFICKNLDKKITSKHTCYIQITTKKGTVQSTVLLLVC